MKSSLVYHTKKCTTAFKTIAAKTYYTQKLKKFWQLSNIFIAERNRKFIFKNCKLPSVFVTFAVLERRELVAVCTQTTRKCTVEKLKHTHPFNGHFSETTQVSRYQKGKTNLDFTEARDSEWQWHQLGHMQVCI